MLNSFFKLKNFYAILAFLLFNFNCFGFDLRQTEQKLILAIGVSSGGTSIADNISKSVELYTDLKAEYQKTKNPEILLFIKFFQKGSEKQKIKNLLYIINEKGGNSKKLYAYANFGLASILASNNSLDNALQYNLEARKILKTTKIFKLEAIVNNQTGYLYYLLRDFKKAKYYFIKAQQISNTDDFLHITSLANIALCDFEMGNYLSSEKKYKGAISLIAKAKENSNQNYFAILKGDLGEVYAKLRKWNLAKENFWFEINYFKKVNINSPTIVQSIDQLLKIYQDEGNIAEINKLLVIIDNQLKHHTDLEIIIKYKRVLYDYHKINSNSSATDILADELIKLENDLNKKISETANNISNTFYSNKIELENKTFENESLLTKAEIKQKKVLIYSLVFFALILISSFIYVSKQRSTKLKNLSLINKQTSEIDNAKRTIVEKELKLKKEMVSNLSIFLNLKTETEKTFLKNIKDLKRKKDQDPENIFRELQTSVISLMNLDKANLEILSTIEQENTDLIEKIHVKFPILNKLECQLCSYFRLGLNSKEISSITNLTPGTIRVYKVKIKQKLNLTEEHNLNQHLQDQDDFRI